MREISLFAGAGGGLLAHRLLGLRPVAYVEWEPYAQEVLRARIRDGHLEEAPIFSDIREFDATPYLGKVDVVTGGFPCFVASTMILAIDGYKPIEEVREGDLVLTHRGRWRAVTATMFKPNAPVRKIKAQGVPEVVCTNEHPFYARRLGRWWDNDNRRYRRTWADADWVEAKTVTNAHFLGQVLPPERPSELTDEWWWLAGRYVADGWRVARHDRPEGNGRVVICCANAEAENLAVRIKTAGYHASPVVEGPITKFHIVRNELYQQLEPFGRYAHGKRLPGFVLELPPTQARAFLEGYFSGDGYRGANAHGTCRFRRATTVSRALALGIALLAQRAYGVVASVQMVRTPRTTIIEGRTVNQRDWYSVTIPELNRSAFVDRDYGWKKVRFNQPCGHADVYNISVEEDESYIADGAVVHNCQSFSLAGKQKAGDDERNMWPDTIRVIREARPRLAFLENVPGLLSGSHGYFGTILGDLAESGYDAVWSGLPAAAVGAPHRRDRLWIVAYTHNPG